MKMATGIIIAIISAVILLFTGILAFAWFLPGPAPFICDEDDYEDWLEDLNDEYEDNEEDAKRETTIVKAEIDEKYDYDDWGGDPAFKYGYSFGDAGFSSDQEFDEGDTIVVVVTIVEKDDFTYAEGVGFNHWFGSVPCCSCLFLSSAGLILGIIFIVMAAMSKNKHHSRGPRGGGRRHSEMDNEDYEEDDW